MLIRFIAVALLLVLCSNGLAQEPIQHIKSRHSVENTVDRLKRIATYHNLQLLGSINYTKLAKQHGETLAPARLIVFADDQGHLVRAMQESQLLALEMPIKILIWEDERGGVWLSYRKLESLTRPHNVKTKTQLLTKLDELAQSLCNEASR